MGSVLYAIFVCRPGSVKMLPVKVARAAVQAGVVRRAMSTAVTATRDEQFHLSPEGMTKFHPKVGNRDIVAEGINSTPFYVDLTIIPMAAVRFGENTPEVLARREKEKGDWKALSLEDKKAIYRDNFCQTFSEIRAPTGEWKVMLTGVLSAIAISGVMLVLFKKYVLPPLPASINESWQHKQLEQYVIRMQGQVDGVASKWDYEKNQWK